MRNFFFLVLVLLILVGCGTSDRKEKESQSSLFNDGALVILSSTSQKDRIKLNEPVQIVASTQKAAKEPKYLVVSSRPDIANVAANGQVITIIGVKAGKTKIIVIDDANGRALAEFDTVIYDPSEGNGGSTGNSGNGDNGGSNDSDNGSDGSIPDDTVTENEIGPIGDDVTVAMQDQMMLLKSVPYGRFIMGDHSSTAKAESLPKHSVVLTIPFWISEAEVTNEQYLAFLNDSNVGIHLRDGVISGDYNHDGKDEVWLKIKPVSSGYMEANLTILEENANYPVVDVSWYGAMAYCRWLSEKQSGTYRLPTEAEWEYAARGNQTNEVGQIVYYRYPWGLDIYERAYANLFGKGIVDTYVSASPVKEFVLGKNLFGLYDMIGNAAEWCYDNYDKYTSLEAVNPFGGQVEGTKVFRGASWADASSQAAISNRGALDPESTSPTLGFRVVRFANGTDPLKVHQSVSKD